MLVQLFLRNLLLLCPVIQRHSFSSPPNPLPTLKISARSGDLPKGPRFIIFVKLLVKLRFELLHMTRHVFIKVKLVVESFAAEFTREPVDALVVPTRGSLTFERW